MITIVITISFSVQVKRSETGHSGAKLQKVDLQVIIYLFLQTGPLVLEYIRWSIHLLPDQVFFVLPCLV